MDGIKLYRLGPHLVTEVRPEMCSPSCHPMPSGFLPPWLNISTNNLSQSLEMVKLLFRIHLTAIVVQIDDLHGDLIDIDAVCMSIPDALYLCSCIV